MSLANVLKRLADLGCVAKINGDEIDLDVGEAQVRIPIDDDWKKAIEAFYRARQYSFDTERRVLTSNRAVEYLVVRLDPGFYYRVHHDFSDSSENVVKLAQASKEFQLSYFESKSYEKSFERIRERIFRRSSRPPAAMRRNARRAHYRFDDLFFNFHTITYATKRKPRGKQIEDVAIGSVKACLFALAYRKDESWELSHEIKSKGLIYPRASHEVDDELEIPRAHYDDAAVTFYKVAKSSQFPSQVFLAYYHILELHFLRVADEALFNAVCAQLNNPDFRSTYENVTKLLVAIKQNDNTSNEKDMLLGVLRKYVAEEELIDFVVELEKSAGEKHFSKPKQKVFGERYSIGLDKGHALNGAAIVVKHIRNALVHSSDKYAREDCFLPLSETEDVVVRYLPIVRFMAERVIFATAKRDL